MSLIGEALKRARLESARREGEERGTAHSSMPAYLPARRRSRAGLVGATLVAALVGAGAVYLLRFPRPPLLGKEEEARTAGPLTEPATPPVMPSLVSSTPPVLPSSVATTPPAPAISPSEPTRELAPPAAPPAIAYPPTPPGARVFVRIARVGAAQLELDGIVASPTDPVAMINRKLLGVGEGLEGWVVEKIEAKQVTLRGGSEVIVLRLR